MSFWTFNSTFFVDKTLLRKWIMWLKIELKLGNKINFCWIFPLSKLLDTDMSPLGFDASQMYGFLSVRFINTPASVQEQTLSWLQVFISVLWFYCFLYSKRINETLFKFLEYQLSLCSQATEITKTNNMKPLVMGVMYVHAMTLLDSWLAHTSMAHIYNLLWVVCIKHLCTCLAKTTVSEEFQPLENMLKVTI